MFLRKLILLFIFCYSTQICFTQIIPWWLSDTIAVDSSEIKATVIADTIVKYAKTYIGVPYIWGGASPDGFDCSGFICYVYAKFGIKLPRTSAEQFNAGIPIPYIEAKPGDLILFSGTETVGGFPGHIGIVLSYSQEKGFTFIHTSSPESGGVRISNENSEKYYYKRFLEIRRVIDVE